MQVVLKQRGKPERKKKNEPLPLCGLISCTTCGMMITGEHKFKRQKNGNVHEYWYYRCSKKNKRVKCTESCISAASLEDQLSSLIKAVSLPADWAVELNRMAKEEHVTSAQSAGASVKERQEQISTITIKLERLLNGYLEQIVDEQDYRNQKAKLLSEKKSLEGEITSLSRNANDWLEPLQKWIKDASSLAEIASDCDLFRKKVAAKEIFGSNLRLGGKALTVTADDAPENGSVSVPSAWAALRAAHEEIGRRPLSCVLVQRY
ncbi:MAG: zinc ribbon domain-containing protein [Candidatus Pacebacteria bacterium]|nr:zinc ribbon domain-containing protein [Candidatus Paceibacterota bacterium]